MIKQYIKIAVLTTLFIAFIANITVGIVLFIDGESLRANSHFLIAIINLFMIEKI